MNSEQRKEVSTKIAILSNVIVFMAFGYLGALLENASYVFSGGTKPISNVVATGFPLYSVGGFMMVGINQVLKPITKNLFVHFLAYGTAATILEYIGGIIVGAGPGTVMADGTVKTWNYSHERFNYKGIISLSHFIAWGLLGIGAVKLHDYLIPRLNVGLESISYYNLKH